MPVPVKIYNMEKERLVLSVSEINRYVKNLIQGDPRLRDLWVAGEISNFKHHRSGHMYFTLKDSASSLRCVFFRRENMRLRFKPTGGMEVILHGNLSVYEVDGQYQLYVSEMEPAGMGSLFLAFEQLKKKLEQEGLFRADHKKPLPFLPRCIGIVTSPTGAALQDIIATVKKRFPHVRLVVAESLVQGEGAPSDLVRALKMLNRTKDVEVIIITRGGGSLEDLWPFNDEAVARAIHSSSLPVISAVGHETDFTIADFVADVRAATPTASVTAVLPQFSEMEARLEQYGDRFVQVLQKRLQREKQLLDYTITDRFYSRPGQRVKQARDKHSTLEEKLKQEMVRSLRFKGMNLAALTEKLEGFSPLRVMERGYSFCQNEKGDIIRSVRNLKTGMQLVLRFIDGEARCRVEQVEESALIDRREEV